jgi:hypothetical protein
LVDGEAVVADARGLSVFDLIRYRAEAINCNDGDQAAKIIQDALGAETDDVAKDNLAGRTRAARGRYRRMAADRGALSGLMPGADLVALTGAWDVWVSSRYHHNATATAAGRWAVTPN